MMMDARSLAYLEAMDIDVWQLRQARAGDVSHSVPPRIVIGAGDGDILCIVGSETEAGLRLASDIGAAMRCTPVWSWPAGEPDETHEVLSIADAVSEKLLTRVLIFGEELAAGLLGNEVPTVISAARVHVVPGLDELARDKEAKRVLWRLMKENGMAASRPGGR